MDAKQLWKQRGEWEIRVLVLSSLSLQIFLLFAGSLRKRKTDWWLRIPLWLAYLLADYIAIYSLGHLSQNQKLCDGSLDEEMHLLVFWAPFLILHLGGQDTITAFAVEDNELWLRHFLSLLSQVGLASYVYWKSLPGVKLIMPAIIMFVAGILKYGERALALKAASMGSLRSSMLTRPDPGPNYAKFVEECQSRTYAGLKSTIVIVPERPPDDDVHMEDIVLEDYGSLLYNAHRLFQTFQRLFVDLILTFQDRIDSLTFFRKLEMEQAFKVVEIELVLMYESLHSKALVIHGWPGRTVRLYTLAAPIISLVLFKGAVGDMQGYPEIDIIISYVLLAGAIFLEIYAVLLIIISPWTYADLRYSSKKFPRAAADWVFWLIKSFQPEKKPRWSNKISQYNLFSYCLKDKPSWYKRLMDWLEWKWNFRVKTMWDSSKYTNKIDLSGHLKSLIFDQIKSKANSTNDPKIYRKLGEHRGQWALQRKGLYQELGWSVDCEFDESILLWHIATDIFFYTKYPAKKDAKKCFRCNLCSCLSRCFPRFSCNCSNPADGNIVYDPMATPSREISNYMLFIMVMRPFMMTASIGQIRFGDTCAEAKNFFHRYVEIKNEQDCETKLMEVDTAIADPRDVKGDRSKSVLFQACKLAKQIKELKGVTDEKRWRLIASVWVEMLCYAAGKCTGNSHARQLSQGGELLTVVWLLMAHFGVGDQYRVESGHARAKLIIET